MFKKYLRLTLVLLLLVPAIAEAKSMFVENFKSEQKKLKSEGQALVMSLLATTTPVVLGGTFFSGNNEEAGLTLALGGLIAGPSFGPFYAGQTKRGMTSMGIRLLVAAGGAYRISSRPEEQYSNSDTCAFAYTGWIVDAVMLIPGIFDICTAPSLVREYNQSILEEKSLRLIPEVNSLNENYGVSVFYNS